jgi:hypothetical protein
MDFNAPPSFLMDSITNSKMKTTEGKGVGTFPGSQHFKGKRVCWNYGMGIMRIDKQINYSHKPIKTKQQVG